jgi:hypothetical protein
MIDRLARVQPRTFAVAAAATALIALVLFAVWPMPQAQELAGGPVLDTRGFRAGAAAAGYVEALGEEGRRLYAIMQVGDLLWTPLHGFTLAAGIALGFTRSSLDGRLAPLAWLPLVGAALDVVENSTFLAAIAAHPSPPPVPPAVMGAVSGLKLTVVGVSYVVLAAALAAWALRPRRR